MVKAKIGDIIEIVWKDAFCESCKSMDELEISVPGDLLVTTSTFGVYYKEDKDAIIILQEKSSVLADYTVIPKNWVMEINNLEAKK